MRLSSFQTRLILAGVRQQFAADAQLKLFGLQPDQTARCGYVDLQVKRAARPSVRKRAVASMALVPAAGLPGDTVAHQRGAHGAEFAHCVAAKTKVLEVQT